ncbi:MAG: HAMP domain-containing sensor histidine kinase [Polyangiaceae bacterium]
MEGRGGTRERLLYYALVPAIVVAVMVLGGIALRTTLQIEKARQQTVFDATWSLADDRVDRLDKLIIAQDNVVAAHVDLAELGGISRRWLATAGRETPTVRSILVLDMDHADHDVLAFASRAAAGGRGGADDDAFRRTLVTRLVPQMNFTGNVEELRHLHVAIDQQYLLSYWQRVFQGQRYLVVAWHDVPSLVHELPRLYRDVDRSTSRMNVIDEEGRLVFGEPIKVGEFTVVRPFPTTLYNWRLQLALTTADELGQKVERQRMIELAMVTLAALVAIAGVFIVVQASVKEQRLAALKSDFVANVSHELKTPLSLVRMFGEMLLDGRVSSEAKRRQYLSIVVSESERLSALIDNVLDFAKVERGKVAYQFEDHDVGTVVARAVDAYRYRAEREEVAVSFKAEPDLPTARVDPYALELVVINLVDNALKYAKEGGEISVDVRRHDRTIDLTVSDRGPGIDADEQGRIFERFVRGKSASKHHVRGSGIGLALVKHIAEAHGGRVRVLSPVAAGQPGTSFVVSLPVSRTGNGPAATSAS